MKYLPPPLLSLFFFLASLSRIRMLFLPPIVAQMSEEKAFPSGNVGAAAAVDHEKENVNHDCKEDDASSLGGHHSGSNKAKKAALYRIDAATIKRICKERDDMYCRIVVKFVSLLWCV